MILAPLRGVTIRSFRLAFAAAIREAGFTEAVTPFIPANAGVDPLKDRELRRPRAPEDAAEPVAVTPQFIGKHPAALRESLLRVKGAGYRFADLNCGCPFPMVRNKGRGSGLLHTPDVLARMLESGCEAMGPGAFSVKARLGVDRPDELLSLMPLLNSFPLRFLVVHARTARQMYEGECDLGAFREVARAAKMPVVLNGDLMPGASLPEIGGGAAVYDIMVGRGFVRGLAARPDISELVVRYAGVSRAELGADRPVLGRLKELLAYWKDLPQWSRRWSVAKLARSLDELLSVVSPAS